MRILFVGINYWPEETGIGPFTTGRCEYLASQGHDVSILTAFPYYPRWKISARYKASLFAREMRNGVTVLRAMLYVPRRITAFRRILHEASFVAGSLLRGMARSLKKPDLIYVVSPPLGLGVVGAMLSRLWRIPCVFHVADLQPDAALDLGMLPGGICGRALYAIERMSYRNAALVSTLTHAMRRRIVAKGTPSEKTTLFSDWADPMLFSDPPPERTAAFRRAFGLDGLSVVLHAGNIGIKQGLQVVLDAAARIGDSERTMHLLVGDGAARPNLERKASTMGLRNLRFTPVLPRESFRDLLAAADICLVTQRRNVADIVFPSKLIALLASGRPVIASVSASSEVARVLTESGAGVVVEPENPEALSEAIASLKRDPDLRAKMSSLGRTYAMEHWSRDRLLPAMAARLSHLAAAQARGPERTDVIAQPYSNAGGDR